MRKLIYSSMVSLDGFVARPNGALDWVLVDEELHTFINNQQRQMGLYCYGRGMYEVLCYWETADQDPTLPAFELEFAKIWQKTPKIVFSSTLEEVEGNTRLVRGDAVRNFPEFAFGGDTAVSIRRGLLALPKGTIRMIQTKNLDLFAIITVADYTAALEWYEQLLGYPPSYIASDTEAVWELAEHRSIAIEHQPEHAGHAMLTIFLDDLDALVTQIAKRGLDPVARETYANGVRKITYRDPDGNEIGFGGAPL